MKHQVDFLELLQIDYEKYPVIAVVGGGGKTSLIYRLTDELIDKGKRVIITRPPIWQENLNFRLPGAEMQSG